MLCQLPAGHIDPPDPAQSTPLRPRIGGDGLRALTPEQLERTKQRMAEIAADGRPRTSSTITFDEGYPPMPPTEGNRRLLALYDEVSRDLGLGPVEPFPPAQRGAADISFAAPFTDALGGLLGREPRAAGR